MRDDPRFAPKVGEPLLQRHGRSGGNGRFDDESSALGQHKAQFFDNGIDETQVGAATGTLRSRQAEKNELGFGDSFDIRIVKGQQPRAPTICDEPMDALLEDGNDAGLQLRDSLFIGLAHPNPVTEVGQPGGGDETNVPGTYDRDIHGRFIGRIHPHIQGKRGKVGTLTELFG